MDIGTVIGSSVAVLIMGFFALVIYRTKDRKETLNIVQKGNTVYDMMASDLKLMTKDVYLQEGGYKTMSYFE